MSYDVPSQEMLTKDSVTVSVDAAVYYRTSDPIASAIFIADAHLSTKQLAQSTLRNVLGKYSNFKGSIEFPQKTISPIFFAF